MVVLDAIVGRERKSWVVWEENGRVPDVVIEILIGVGEYYLYDPYSGISRATGSTHPAR